MSKRRELAALQITATGDSLIQGQFTNNGVVDVAAGQTLVFNDDVDGAGEYTGDGTVQYNQTFSPGNSPAPVAFGGNVMLTSTSALEIELGGLVRGDDYDAVLVTGELTAGGTLQVTLIDEFAPGLGDTFDILDWGTLAASEFDAVELHVLGRTAWDTSKLYTDGEISVIGMLPGDTDIDWDVDPDDYGTLLDTFGGVADWRTDFNEDGVIDIADFALQRAHYGQDVSPSNGPGDMQATIPEPATIFVIGAGWMLLLRRRSRK